MSGFLIDTGWVNLAYLVASILFIRGMKGLTHPRTAVQGNLTSALGMLLAIVVTLFSSGLDYKWIVLGVFIGTVNQVDVMQRHLPGLQFNICWLGLFHVIIVYCLCKR